MTSVDFSIVLTIISMAVYRPMSNKNIVLVKLIAEIFDSGNITNKK